MKTPESTNLTKGIDIFVSVIKKHKVVAVTYIVLQCLSFMIQLFQSPTPLRFILSILSLLMPIGIAFILSLDIEKDTNVIKSVIAAGFIGLLINALNSLYLNISVITSTLFAGYEFLYRLVAYAGLAYVIVALCIVILFLILIFSNSNYFRMMGGLLILLVISSIVLFVIGYAGTFGTMNVGDFQQVPLEFRFSIIINWIGDGLGILSTLFWITIEFFVAQHLLKSRPSVEQK